jgi:hypothetical protein
MFRSILNKISTNKAIKQRQKRIIEICFNQDKECPEYFYEMMRLKLENLLEISKKDPLATFDPKYVHIAIRLCKLLEENKTTYYRPINVLNYKNYEECKDWDLNTKREIDFEIVDDLVFKIDAKLRAKFYKIKAKNLLFKIINKNILYWNVL